MMENGDRIWIFVGISTAIAASAGTAPILVTIGWMLFIVVGGFSLLYRSIVV